MAGTAKRVNNNNGHATDEFPKFAVRHARKAIMLSNSEQAALSRLAIMAAGGMLPEIDIDSECRYPKQLTLKDMKDAYDREGTATRVVEVYPQESWAMPPDIYETENLNQDTPFEKQWKSLNETFKVLPTMEKADEAAHIGQFGGVLMGFDDGRSLDQPVFAIKADGTVDERFGTRRLTFLRPMSQCVMTVKELETNTSNPRYGQPKSYQVDMLSNDFTQTKVAGEQNFSMSASGKTVTTSKEVHWTRVLHIPANPKESDVFGMPSLQNTWNRVFDIKKILGANGQGYWQNGSAALSLETQPQVEDPDLDIDAVKEEIKDFMMGLQKYLALEGMTAKSLNFQVAEPWPHVEAHIRIICIALGCPMRVFLGTEEAKLASSQDMRTWNKRLMRRQNDFITPYIIRPFLERMFNTGVLVRPKNLTISWPDLNAPTENDRATTAQKVATALMNYVQGNVFVIIQPREYLVNVLGFTPKVVDTVIKAAGGEAKMLASLQKMLTAATAPPVAAGKKPASKRGKKPGFADGAGPAS